MHIRRCGKLSVKQVFFFTFENYQLSRCSFSHLNCVIVPHLLRGIGQYLSIALENEIQTNKMQF